MWNLEDDALYFKLLDETIAHAFTWGDRDREKREAIRGALAARFPNKVPAARWWAFRLYARKRSVKGYDVENIPKLVVDAFSGRQIQQDRSAYASLALYPDDTVSNVAMVQVAGEAADRDSTRIEVFGRRV